jgi:hypothetical protein
MTAAKVAAVCIVSVTAMLVGCDEWASSDREARISVSTAPGLAVPDINQLGKRLESSLRYPQLGTKVYTREDGKWVEVKPVPVGKHFSAVVRAFDPRHGMAYIELTYREYNMPLVQIWRFDGKAWSDSVDPGIFTR